VSKLGELHIYETEVRVELTFLGTLTIGQLEKLTRVAKAAQDALPDQPFLGKGTREEVEEAIARNKALELDSAAALVAVEEPTGEEAVEQPVLAAANSPAAPLPQANPAFAPGGHAKGSLCPECGFIAKDNAGLGSHRQKKHGVAGTSVGAKSAKPQLVIEGDPTEPNGHNFKAEDAKKVGIEWFLCNACPARYTTRLRLDQHRERTHTDREPRRMPVGRGPARTADQAAQRILRGGV